MRTGIRETSVTEAVVSAYAQEFIFCRMTNSKEVHHNSINTCRFKHVLPRLQIVN